MFCAGVIETSGDLWGSDGLCQLRAFIRLIERA